MSGSSPRTRGRAAPAFSAAFAVAANRIGRAPWSADCATMCVPRRSAGPTTSPPAALGARHQIRAGQARMRGQRVQPAVRAPVEFEREHQVRDLGPAVAEPVRTVRQDLEVRQFIAHGELVQRGGHRHHARLLRRQQQRQQMARQGEVPEMVDADLDLEAVRGVAGRRAPSRPRCSPARRAPRPGRRAPPRPPRSIPGWPGPRTRIPPGRPDAPAGSAPSPPAPGPCPGSRAACARPSRPTAWPPRARDRSTRR